MKKIIKIILCIVLPTVLIMSLVSCGDNKKDELVDTWVWIDQSLYDFTIISITLNKDNTCVYVLQQYEEDDLGAFGTWRMDGDKIILALEGNNKIIESTFSYINGYIVDKDGNKYVRDSEVEI